MSVNKQLYIPAIGQVSSSAKLRRSINENHALNLADYQQLYLWSTSQFDLFWRAVWDYEPALLADSSPGLGPVVDIQATPDLNPTWFKGLTLNWAENMLEPHRASNSTALIQARKSHFSSV